MLQYYTGYRPGDVPGNLHDPFRWWQAGAMCGALIDYWYFTGDDQYNAITTQALLHQVGSGQDFLPANHTFDAGNDDQAFWAFSALQAAEYKFPDPPEDKPQWLALAQAVFQTQANRWNTETCGGGLKWQIQVVKQGYNYKNAISNGAFFNLGARLGKYTGNTTYLEWAERSWDWAFAIGLIDNNRYVIYDGTDDKPELNCTRMNHIQWSYNAGVYLYGAAVMWNTTSDEVWRQRTLSLMNATSVFFHREAVDVMYEVACEGNGKCDIDQRSFKAYLARWMSATMKVAPFTADYILPKLRASALAAARQCSGGENGTTCGLRWTQAAHDGSTGFSEQIAALEVFQNNLMAKVDGPVTEERGGTSRSDPTAGTRSRDMQVDPEHKEITTADKAGAAIITIMIVGGWSFLAYWMVT
ncbi:glycoside hydrolase family 76 protein [Patellaria atrata CBS 101060]|uniref:Mannan endo-1,6-alpha-mannosidase n=1 Tax=Patellaria atrata CBS 101060 TaxID=1346257 RepID=A0A9P4SE96_9PEZI|nr:glycoside hydrolase family 76 protein [Patellaria atrata CBS 101060]